MDKEYEERERKRIEQREFRTQQIIELMGRNEGFPWETIKEVKEFLETVKYDHFHKYSDKEGNINFEKVLLTVLAKIQNRAKVKEIETSEDTKLIRKGFSLKQGSLVKVRPCGDEYKDKTYLGFYLGDMATGFSGKFKEDKLIIEHSGYDPAIFIPEVGKIVFGYESWWGEVKSEEELKDITDDDISNVWYVKIMRAMSKAKEKEDVSEGCDDSKSGGNGENS